MLVLLPPSEGKAESGDGAALDLGALSLPELTDAREQVLDALVALSTGKDEANALAVLGLSQGQAGELTRNARLRTAGTLPAAELYTGVLYDNLGLDSLSPAALAYADEALLVFSGLWGVVRITDRIPPYRLSGGVKLPPLGGLGAFWRKRISALPSSGGLVLDLRSTAYASLWRPDRETAGRTATVRVLHQQPDGSRKVVSHFNKATKGRLVRGLLESGARPGSPAELADALRDSGFKVEAEAPTAGRPWALDVVVDQV